MALEGDIDAKMSRTANRPIPRGRITPGEAMAFGLTLSFFSVMTLGILVNWLAGGLLAFTIFFYVVIYTMAKIPKLIRGCSRRGNGRLRHAPWPVATGQGAKSLPLHKSCA